MPSYEAEERECIARAELWKALAQLVKVVAAEVQAYLKKVK